MKISLFFKLTFYLIFCFHCEPDLKLSWIRFTLCHLFNFSPAIILSLLGVPKLIWWYRLSGNIFSGSKQVVAESEHFLGKHGDLTCLCISLLPSAPYHATKAALSPSSYVLSNCSSKLTVCSLPCLYTKGTNSIHRETSWKTTCTPLHTQLLLHSSQWYLLL